MAYRNTFVICFLFVCSFVYAQEPVVNIVAANITIEQAFRQIEKQTLYTIAFNRTKLDVGKRISLSLKKATIEKALTEILKNSGFGYKITGNHIVIVENRQPTEVKTKPVTTSGYIYDQQTGERLIGVNVIQSGTAHGTTTDNNGYFSIRLKEASGIQTTYVGYQSVIIEITRDTLVEIRMKTNLALDEVVVTASRRLQPNTVTLSKKEMLGIPALGGKPDVMKVIQLLPGIKSQNEGSSLLMVRGGNPGENLYLLDNIPLTYVHHLGGFMSVFNPDMINGLDIYKGGFPPRYGSKLSSVVDITQREGDASGLKGSLGIGVTDISFTVEGPTKLKNSSFIVTGRKTLTEAYMGLASGLSDINVNSFIVMYGFHDINAKFSWKPDTRNSLHLNLYQGDDYLHYHTKKDLNGKSRMNNIWGNWLVSARWNHTLTPKLTSASSLSYTRYRLKDKKKYDALDGEFFSEYLSSVQDASLRTDWKYIAMKAWTMNFGIQASLLTHMPNRTRQSNIDTQQPGEKLHTMETALYLDNRLDLFGCVTAHIGGRAVYYDAGSYSDYSLEPRLRLNVNIAKNHALNASYMTVNQNSHLVFTAGNIMNNEVWVPASGQFPEALAEQYSAGWTGSFADGMFQAELDVYYKRLHRMAMYREGYTSLMGDTDWQSKIIGGGRGEAKGMEFLLRKTSGKWTGFASYAWSKSTRQYPDINGSAEYIYEYDRPHTFSLSVNRQINDQWSFNAAWVYMTGLPYTPAIGRQIYSYENENDYREAMIYGERNSARMRPYHRLDLGFNYTKTTRNGRKAVWTFSIYNVYNRHNPYFYYYNENNSSEMWWPGYYWGKNHSMNLYQVSFFPIIPTVSYKLYFDRNAHKRYKANMPPRERDSFGGKLKKYLYHE